MKYLLDEHVDPVLRTALHHHSSEITVWVVGDPGAPARGTADPDVLFWCEEFDFVLVTNNRSSIPQHLRDHLQARRHVPGIFIINTSLSIGKLAAELALIWEAAESDEFRDQINWLPL